MIKFNESKRLEFRDGLLYDTVFEELWNYIKKEWMSKYNNPSVRFRWLRDMDEDIRRKLENGAQTAFIMRIDVDNTDSNMEDIVADFILVFTVSKYGYSLVDGTRPKIQCQEIRFHPYGIDYLYIAKDLIDFIVNNVDVI